MTSEITRRNFIKLSLLTLGSLATRSYQEDPPEESENIVGVGRVASSLIYVYNTPSFGGLRRGRIPRDEILRLYEEVQSPHGPTHNPVWYRIQEGFVHSGRIQRVDGRHINSPLGTLPEKKILGQVTVPFTQSYRINRNEVWKPLYRLYYESLHWISKIVPGPDQSPWYRLTDERLLVHYYIPALHIQPILNNELSTLSSPANQDDRRILISIQAQTLTAFEKETVVLHTKISSGLLDEDKKRNDISTETPLGSFRIRTKFPVRHMGNGYLTADPEAYELPGVPWTMFFHESGFALHGTYWHNNFGTRMSHGCINMRNDEAGWLFRWTEPAYQPGEWYTSGSGTLVQIIE